MNKCKNCIHFHTTRDKERRKDFYFCTFIAGFVMGRKHKPIDKDDKACNKFIKLTKA